MERNLKKGIAGLALLGSLGAGADASNFERVPVQAAVYDIASERVSVKQTGNVVEAVMPWKGEKGLTIKHDLGEPTASERVKDKEKKRVIAEPVTDFEGGFKIDILLSEKPDTNTFCYDIEGHEDYDFFYQPALTAEEIAEGAVRPEEIVGSYAVYHKTLKNHKVGGINYATGKVLHIPFPYVWEVGKEDQKVRAENLTYEDGQLCVVASQSFLDNADYSNGVRIDPTFGYTSVGATNENISNKIAGTRHTSPSDAGEVTSMSIYAGKTGVATQGETVKGVIVLQSNLNIISNGVTNATASIFGLVFDWRTVTFSANPTLSTSVDYVLSAIGGTVGFMSVKYDAGTTGYGYLDTTNSLASPTNPTDATTNDRKYSIYATYTASGGGSTPAPATFVPHSVY